MLSRVVPETSDTITRFSLRTALTIDDLPAFGRPTIAIFIIFPARFLPEFQNLR